MLVVKIGGSAGVDLSFVCADIAALSKKGESIVIVHGGSDETNKLSTALGHPPRFVTSESGVQSRYTDRETLDIFAMAVAGKINTNLVSDLQKRGANAFGLSGVDGRTLQGRRKEALRIVDSDGRRRVIRDDYTGRVETVNGAILEMLLQAGYIPVIAPLAITPEGDPINVDGDLAAAIIARTLKAERLIILSNVPGLLRQVGDETSLVTHIARADFERYTSLAQGRMKKKVMGAAEALAGGVSEVVLADARRESPVSEALTGKGTVIR